MLQNASLLAIVAVDTAENEPFEVWRSGKQVGPRKTLGTQTTRTCSGATSGTSRIGRSVTDKDTIEKMNFSIEFSPQFQKFHRILSKFCKFSGILNNFGHFWARSRNSDKISSRFRREISFSNENLWTFDWIFNIQFRKNVADFKLKFWGLNGAKEC